MADYINDLVADASNIRTGANPAFDVDDFLEIYPQFGQDSDNVWIVPEIMIEMYLNLAHASIKESRWKSTWRIGMSLFIAHFCTLYLQSFASADSGSMAVMEAGQARGLITSESVDGVSVSIDYNSIAQDLDGWAAYKLTGFGIQLATFAKSMGRGGMYIY